VLDTVTGKVVAAGALETGKACSALAWAPQADTGPQGPAGYRLASAADTDITLWSVDPYGGCMLGAKVVAGNVRRQVTCLAFSADGQWLFAGVGRLGWAGHGQCTAARATEELKHPLPLAAC
jgi:hypothetical protein